MTADTLNHALGQRLALCPSESVASSASGDAQKSQKETTFDESGQSVRPTVRTVRGRAADTLSLLESVRPGVRRASDDENEEEEEKAKAFEGTLPVGPSPEPPELEDADTSASPLLDPVGLYARYAEGVRTWIYRCPCGIAVRGLKRDPVAELAVRHKAGCTLLPTRPTTARGAA
jgi:hypothetical protein